MIEINNVELKKNIDILNSLMKKYESVKDNLFSQLDSSCINWSDGNSREFNKKIYLDKKETDLLFRYLTNVINLFEYIYSSYIEIGKNIKCNLNKKDNVLYSLDDLNEQINDIYREYDLIDTNIEYSKLETILSLKQKIAKSGDNLTKTKNNINQIYKRIASIEDMTNEKIKELEEIEITAFEFAFGDTKETSLTSYLNIDEFGKNVVQIDYYINEENNELKVIYDKLDECNKNYFSSNNLLLTSVIENIKNIIESVLFKRGEYLNVLNKVIPLYNDVSERVIANLNKGFDLDDGIRGKI